MSFALVAIKKITFCSTMSEEHAEECSQEEIEASVTKKNFSVNFTNDR